MIAGKTPWVSALVGLVVVVSLAMVAHWARRDPGTGCALDGMKIDPVYRVEVVDGGGGRHAFCCPTCARLWLKQQPIPPATITVTDEASGEATDAATAHYVRSPVVTTPSTGNRIHVFRSRDDAEKHANTFGGIVLPESEYPFRP
ncbi:MAG TPA: hypothetical protein VKA46_31540 [Gemmataceae bacterium]|nr:hypothetical protein [Gemmataceae bacterium]